MFSLGQTQPRRRPSLTPMIDVVFLLLVFFMLAAKFGAEGAVSLTTGGSAAQWQGAPRLVEFAPGALWLNGMAVDVATLPDALRALMPMPDAPVILRPRSGADVQSLVSLSTLLRDAGFDQLIVAKGEP